MHCVKTIEELLVCVAEGIIEAVLGDLVAC
jgi:hypothetical protein